MTAYEMRISYWSSDVCSSDLNSDTDNEIPEMLARLALTSKAAECVVQHVEKRCLTDILLHHAIETLAMKSDTEIEIVLARRAPRTTDFCAIGARATIGATAHS